MGLPPVPPIEESTDSLHGEVRATSCEPNRANDDPHSPNPDRKRGAEPPDIRQQQLQETRDLLEAVVDSLGCALVVVDPTGHPRLANPAYRQLRADLAGATVEDLDGRPLGVETLAEQRAARGETYTMAFTAVDTTGGRRWFEAIGRPLREAGRGDAHVPHTGGVVAIRDMTDRTLRRLQDEFLATASHELRNPITAIVMYAGLLRRMAGASPSDRASHILDDLVLETRRLQLLVNDLMDIARLKSGHVPVSRQRVDLSATLRRAVDLARYLGKGQAITVEIPEAPVRVDADPNRLEQVLVNLLENAVLHGNGGGGAGIEVLLAPSEGGVAVTIRDHGHGISAEDLPRVFDRFFRSRESTRRAAGGLGLGLHISKQLVAAQGGRLSVASREGDGAAFTVWLPLAGPDEGTTTAAGESPAG